jgi:hypothetical protein
MLLKTSLLLPLIASLVAGTPLSTRQSEDNSSQNAIEWVDVTEEYSEIPGMAGLKAFLGTLAVPLDYTQPKADNNTLQLDILKIPAVKEPKLGSVLTNWGGPGIPATQDLAGFGLLISALVSPLDGQCHSDTFH